MVVPQVSCVAERYSVWFSVANLKMDDHRRKIIIAIAAVSGHNLLRSIERLAHEESSDEEYDYWIQEANIFTARIRIGGDKRKRVIRIQGYVNTIVSQYTERQFREHFRMTRETYENLEQTLAPDLIRSAESGRSTLDVRIQLLAVLWLLATPDSFRSVSDRFGISKSLLHDSMRRVVGSLNNIANNFIKWPQGDVLDAVKHRFSQIGSLPDVIGAIDGTHIPIPAPKVKVQFIEILEKRFKID